jgi:hypothetical protein
MANYNFRKDLKIGQEAEKAAFEALSKRLTFDSVEYNHDNRYDFKVKKGELEKTYEVKRDLMCGQTGNFALEYECRGKPSGIVTTQADYWIYQLDDGFYLISVTDLKNLIDEAKYFRMVTGGDRGSRTKMFLFKLNLMKEAMHKL